MFLLESLIAQKLTDGASLVFEDGYVQFNDRLLQKEIIARLRTVPDVVFLGSSTTMQVSSSFFPKKTFMNHSLRRGVMEDYFAIIQLYRDRGLRLKNVVLGLDSWIFDPHHWREYWKSLAGEYQRLADDYGITWQTGNEKRYRFESRISELREFLKKVGWKKLLLVKSLYFNTKGGVKETSLDLQEGYLRRPDGSVGYHATFRNLHKEEVSRKIGESKDFRIYKRDSESIRAFEIFVEKLRKEGVKLGFYLPGLHPKIFDMLGKNDVGEEIKNYREFIENLNEVERILRQIADQNGIPVYGSFRPDARIVGEDDFHDWIHMKSDAIQRVFTNPL